MTLPELNGLSREAAAQALRACCGASRWAESMADARPFPSHPALLARAAEIWRALPSDAWLEAFAAHPRIGARVSGAEAQEQAGTHSASAPTRAALAEANRRYEERFGHVFLVFATGKSAEEMLEICRARLHNDPAVELSIAAAEQEKITRLRLEKLLTE